MSDDREQQPNSEPKPEPKPEVKIIQPTERPGLPKGFDSIDWVQKSQDPEVTRKDRGSDE